MAKLTDNSDEIYNSIVEAVIGGLKEVGTAETASVKANTPVKTGNLRRSIRSTKPVKSGREVIVKIGSDVLYAPKVEFENKSYLRYTLKNDEKEIQGTLLKHLRSVAK